MAFTLIHLISGVHEKLDSLLFTVTVFYTMVTWSVTVAQLSYTANKYITVH